MASIMFVLQAACGGCHMLVFAIPRPKELDEICVAEPSDHSLAPVVSEVGGDSLLMDTLHRTLSARMRRRERVNFLTTFKLQKMWEGF